MRIAVKLKSGEEGIIVGYAPGKKGRVLAIVVIEAKFREVKLRSLEIIGWAKLREARNSAFVLDEVRNIPEEVWNNFRSPGKPN